MLELWDRFCGQTSVRHFTLNLAAALMIFGGVSAAFEMAFRLSRGEFFLNLAIFLPVIGWGLLNYKPWARTWTILLNGLALLACAVALVVSLFLPRAGYGLLYEVTIPYVLMLLPFLVVITGIALLTLTVMMQKETVVKFKQRHRAEHWTQILIILFVGAFLVQGWLIWKNDRFIQALEVTRHQLTLVVRDAATGKPLNVPVHLTPPTVIHGDIFAGPLNFSFAAETHTHTMSVRAVSLAPFALRVSAQGYADTTLTLCEKGERLEKLTLHLQQLPKNTEVTP